jgi:NAD-dependent DNA ligase
MRKSFRAISSALCKLARILNGVSAKTDYVVVGKDAGAKEKQALDLGVTIWDEETWLSKIK